MIALVISDTRYYFRLSRHTVGGAATNDIDAEKCQEKTTTVPLGSHDMTGIDYLVFACCHYSILSTVRISSSDPLRALTFL